MPRWFPFWSSGRETAFHFNLWCQNWLMHRLLGIQVLSLKGWAIFWKILKRVNHTISMGNGFKFRSFPKNLNLGKDFKLWNSYQQSMFFLDDLLLCQRWFDHLKHTIFLPQGEFINWTSKLDSQPQSSQVIESMTRAELGFELSWNHPNLMANILSDMVFFAPGSQIKKEYL